MKSEEEWISIRLNHFKGESKAEWIKAIQLDAQIHGMKESAEIAKHKCDQWPCFDSDYCRGQTDSSNKILSTITELEKEQTR